MDACAMAAALGGSMVMAASTLAADVAIGHAGATGLESMDARNSSAPGGALNGGLEIGNAAAGLGTIAAGSGADAGLSGLGGAIGSSGDTPACESFDSRSLPAPGTLGLLGAGLALGGRRRR